MVKQLNLRASLGKNLAIRSDVCRVGKVVDEKNVDGVCVVFGRPDVDSMSDQGPVKVGKDEPFRSFRLISVKMWCYTVVQLSNLWVYDHNSAPI